MTFSADAVSEFLSKDEHAYMGKPTEHEDELLDMDSNIDITCNVGRYVMIKFRLPDDKPDNIQKIYFKLLNYFVYFNNALLKLFVPN